ncbi:MAG: ABC transporter permease [Pseudomonadota bacterium]
MVVWRLASIALVAGAWEVGGRIPLSFAFPPFSDTALALWAMIWDGALAKAYASTLQPLVIGLLISAAAGVGFGVAMGLSRVSEWLLAPVFIILQAAPVAAFIPLITYVYGIGLTAKVVAVCLLSGPLIVLNSYRGIRNADAALIEMSRSFQATRRQEVVKIVLPHASPVIFAGLRLGVAGGFIGVVLAELLITPTGIGDLITYHRSVADYPEMFAAILSIILFAAVTVGLLERTETVLFRPERRAKEQE